MKLANIMEKSVKSILLCLFVGLLILSGFVGCPTDLSDEDAGTQEITGAISYDTSTPAELWKTKTYSVTVEAPLSRTTLIYRIVKGGVRGITINPSGGDITIAGTVSAGIYPGIVVSVRGEGLTGLVKSAPFSVTVNPLPLTGSLAFEDKTVRAEVASILAGRVTFRGLIAGTDYTLSISPEETWMSIADNGKITITNAIREGGQGRYIVRAVGIGNYAGSVEDEFYLSVDPPLDDAEKVEADKDALNITAAVGGNLQAVTKPTFILPLAGAYGTTIGWTSSDSVISINGEIAEVVLPDVNGTDTGVTLTATISLNGENDKKTFDLKVLKDTALDDQESVGADSRDLDADSMLFAQGDSMGFVTQDFSLPTSGANRTTISWESDKKATISINGSTAEVTVRA